MSTSFISHRMFVAALNHDRPPTTPAAERAERRESTVRGALGAANELTVEQLAAFAARYWPDFPFAQGLKRSVY